MRNLFTAFLLAAFVSLPLGAQKHSISGFITDLNSGERLIGANIYDKATLSGSVSNNYGFYSLPVPQGMVELVISYVGYEPVLIQVELSRDTVINFPLSVSSREIEEVTIIGGRQSKVESTQMSMVDIPVEIFLKLPVLLGEADVLKVIQLLPGVQSGTEGATGIYVRGGGPDQNLFLHSVTAHTELEGDFISEPVIVYSNVENGLGIIGAQVSSGFEISYGDYPVEGVKYESYEY